MILSHLLDGWFDLCSYVINFVQFLWSYSSWSLLTSKKTPRHTIAVTISLCHDLVRCAIPATRTLTSAQSERPKLILILIYTYINTFKHHPSAFLILESEWLASKVCRESWGRPLMMSYKQTSGTLSTWIRSSHLCSSTCSLEKAQRGEDLCFLPFYKLNLFLCVRTNLSKLNLQRHPLQSGHIQQEQFVALFSSWLMVVPSDLTPSQMDGGERDEEK